MAEFPSKSKFTHASMFRDQLKAMIKGVFNREIFGTYEAVIEVVDTANAEITVSIPALNDLKMSGCRIAMPCQSPIASIHVPFQIGSRVIVTFNEFSLGSPIVIGQIANALNTPSLTSDMVFTNGASSITMKPDGTIALVGAAGNITANGEDLTFDDIGVL